MSTLKVNTLQDVSGNVQPFGIKEFDIWYLTSNNSSNGDITSNLSRYTSAGGASPLGTGMSESSGIFSFPSTGKYLVICNPMFELNGYDNANVQTAVTTNNSSYTEHCIALDGNNGSGSRAGSGTSFAFVDVTDTSNVKVKFILGSLGSGSYMSGGSSVMYSNFVFVRIGDT